MVEQYFYHPLECLELDWFSLHQKNYNPQAKICALCTMCVGVGQCSIHGSSMIFDFQIMAWRSKETDLK